MMKGVFSVIVMLELSA